jgi:hypothetical protein
VDIAEWAQQWRESRERDELADLEEEYRENQEEMARRFEARTGERFPGTGAAMRVFGRGMTGNIW